MKKLYVKQTYNINCRGPEDEQHVYQVIKLINSTDYKINETLTRMTVSTIANHEDWTVDIT